jgi:hypothetical protein
MTNFDFLLNEKKTIKSEEKTERTPVRTNIEKEILVPDTDRQEVRPIARTPVRRTITRYAFEFYQDQIDTLRKTSLEEKMNGEKGSMSEMVREAIDLYIKKIKRTEGK